MRNFFAGLAIATVRAGDGTPHGLTVNSFTSVLICIGQQCQALHRAERPRVRPGAAAGAFARRIDNRFEDQRWFPGETGAPLIPGALATMECRLVNVIELGDHWILVGEMVAASIGEGSPLVYFQSAWRRLA